MINLILTLIMSVSIWITVRNTTQARLVTRRKQTLASAMSSKHSENFRPLENVARNDDHARVASATARWGEKDSTISMRAISMEGGTLSYRALKRASPMIDVGSLFGWFHYQYLIGSGFSSGDPRKRWSLRGRLKLTTHNRNTMNVYVVDKLAPAAGGWLTLGLHEAGHQEMKRHGIPFNPRRINLRTDLNSWRSEDDSIVALMDFGPLLNQFRDEYTRTHVEADGGPAPEVMIFEFMHMLWLLEAMGGEQLIRDYLDIPIEQRDLVGSMQRSGSNMKPRMNRMNLGLDLIYLVSLVKFWREGELDGANLMSLLVDPKNITGSNESDRWIDYLLDGKREIKEKSPLGSVEWSMAAKRGRNYRGRGLLLSDIFVLESKLFGEMLIGSATLCRLTVGSDTDSAAWIVEVRERGGHLVDVKNAFASEERHSLEVQIAPLEDLKKHAHAKVQEARYVRENSGVSGFTDAWFGH